MGMSKKKQEDWIDVNDRLPENGQIVLAYVSAYKSPRCYRVMQFGLEGKDRNPFFNDDRNSILYPPDNELGRELAPVCVGKWIPIPAVEAAPSARSAPAAVGQAKAPHREMKHPAKRNPRIRKPR
jgi:hypothetical protein